MDTVLTFEGYKFWKEEKMKQDRIQRGFISEMKLGISSQPLLLLAKMFEYELELEEEHE